MDGGGFLCFFRTLDDRIKLPCPQVAFHTLNSKVDIVRCRFVLIVHADHQSVVLDLLWVSKFVSGELTSVLLGNFPLLSRGGHAEIRTRESTRSTGRQVFAARSLGLECHLAVAVVLEAPDLEDGLLVPGESSCATGAGIRLGGDVALGFRYLCSNGSRFRK